MAYGFAVALAAEGSLSATDLSCGEEVLISRGGLQLTKPGSGSLLLTSAPKEGRFIATAEVGHWFVVSIGADCSGNAPAISVQQHLLNISTPVADDIRAAFQQLFGQYAAVAFDTGNGEYVAVTDPSGIRSLFSCRTEDALIIASSIPMLKRLRTKSVLVPDEENQSFLFRYGYSLPTRSVLKDVCEIAPGKLIHANCGQPEQLQNHEPATSQAASADTDHGYANVDLHLLSDKHERKLLKYLLQSCSEQLGEARKVGVLLGGFDSALVASLLVKLGVEVETYSFHYEAEQYNQPYVDELAHALGIKHHWVRITPEVIRKGIDEYGANCNWPTLWLNYVVQTQYLCQQMARDGMQSCFSGDGCDTMFLGYPSTYRRGRIYQKLPRIRESSRRVLVSTFHAMRLESVFGHIGRVFLSLLSAATYPSDERAMYSFQLFDSHLQRRLTNSSSVNSEVADEHFARVLKQTADLPFERKIYLAKSYISPNRCKLVSSSDMSGLIIHSPYMHPNVMEFARGLPLEALRPKDGSGSCEGKYLLMKMAENAGLLSRDVIYQPKLAAISSPIDRWLADELRGFALKKFGSLPFEVNECYVNDLLEEKWFERIYKRYFSTDNVVSLAPSLLLTYASFYE